jgi:hypothetical protein
VKRVSTQLSLGLSKTHVKCLIECPNLNFKCDSCLTECYRPLEDKIDSLTKDVSDLKNAVNRLIGNKQTPIIHSDLSRQRQLKPTNATPASSRGKSTGENRNAKIVHGTGPKISNISIAEPKYWVHLSGLDPETNEDDLSEFVNTSFAVDSIKCVKLIPKNRPLSTCESIAFKIGFPITMENVALNSSSWPEGFAVREFVDKQPPAPNMGFRGPRGTPFRRNQGQQSGWSRYQRNGRY